MAGLEGEGVWVGPPVLGNVVGTTCSSVTKTEFPCLACVGSWLRLAQLGPWDTGSLQCQLSPKDGDSACGAPRVVAHPHQGCVVALGDTAATQSQPGAPGQAGQTDPAKSFISDRKSSSPPQPEQLLGL